MRTLLTICVVLLASTVSAAPFLVCDPQEGVDSYNIYRDGELVGSDVPAQPDGSLRLDVAPYRGAAEWTATATNVWGDSEPSNPYQSPAATSSPAGLRIVP